MSEPPAMSLGPLTEAANEVLYGMTRDDPPRAEGASAAARPGAQPLHHQRGREAPTVVAVERMAKKRFDLLQPVGHGPRRQVESPSRSGHVFAGVEVGLERLDELPAEPLVGKQRAELASHGGLRELRVCEEQALEGELLRVRNPATQAEPLGGSRGVHEIGIRRGQRANAVDRS